MLDILYLDIQTDKFQIDLTTNTKDSQSLI